MAGGTRLHRWIYEASLGRDERSIRFRKEENEPPAVRKLSVSLDRADNVIEGGPVSCGNETRTSTPPITPNFEGMWQPEAHDNFKPTATNCRNGFDTNGMDFNGRSLMQMGRPPALYSA